jgi:hypothetical protein|tara:strand:- start:179 stop:1504 length:1326 start_codon:yes stop_codon:yes gene_type:complete
MAVKPKKKPLKGRKSGVKGTRGAISDINADLRKLRNVKAADRTAAQKKRIETLTEKRTKLQNAIAGKNPSIGKGEGLQGPVRKDRASGKGSEENEGTSGEGSVDAMRGVERKVIKGSATNRSNVKAGKDSMPNFLKDQTSPGAKKRATKEIELEKKDPKAYDKKIKDENKAVSKKAVASAGKASGAKRNKAKGISLGDGATGRKIFTGKGKVEKDSYNPKTGEVTGKGVTPQKERQLDRDLLARKSTPEARERVAQIQEKRAKEGKSEKTIERTSKGKIPVRDKRKNSGVTYKEKPGKKTQTSTAPDAAMAKRGGGPKGQTVRGEEKQVKQKLSGGAAKREEKLTATLPKALEADFIAKMIKDPSFKKQLEKRYKKEIVNRIIAKAKEKKARDARLNDPKTRRNKQKENTGRNLRSTKASKGKTSGSTKMMGGGMAYRNKT